MSLNDVTKKAVRVALANNSAADEVIAALNAVDGATSTPEELDAAAEYVGDLTATAVEVNAACDGKPHSATLTPAAGGANVCEVTIQVKDTAGANVAVPVILDVLLSDAATGTGLTATTASGTVQAKSASGTDLSVMVAKKALRVQTKADGTYVLEITDSAKTGFYVVANIPGKNPSVSSALVTGNYGS